MPKIDRLANMLNWYHVGDTWLILASLIIIFVYM